MDVSIATFNLNNLFGRWNLYVEVAETRALATVERALVATEPPRDWLAEPPPLARTRARDPRDADRPDVRIILEGEFTAERIKWRLNPADGRVVYRKSAEARRVLARRIRALDADVLALQEVESIEALTEFVDEEGLDDYPHLVLVEGNDPRLIDVALASRLPIGAVTSWRHRVFKTRPHAGPVFSRDLLEAEILSPRRDRVLFTVFNNHLKSKFARNDEEARAADVRRRRQAETIAAIIGERRRGPFVVVGDMNDRPTAATLRGVRDLGLVNGLADPDETGGPYPPDDPDQPKTKSWTHRHRGEGRTRYELFDQIWLSRDLARKQAGASIQRRKTRAGDATDHDPALVVVRL